MRIVHQNIYKNRRHTNKSSVVNLKKNKDRALHLFLKFVSSENNYTNNQLLFIVYIEKTIFNFNFYFLNFDFKYRYRKYKKQLWMANFSNLNPMKLIGTLAENNWNSWQKHAVWHIETVRLTSCSERYSNVLS